MKLKIMKPCFLSRAVTILGALLAAGATEAANDLQPLRQISRTTAGDQFGYSVAAVGTNRFAVSAPYVDPNFGGTVTNAGFVYIYDLNTNYVAMAVQTSPEKDAYFGTVLADVGVDMLAVGVPYKDFTYPPPSLLFSDSGAVYLYDY